MRTRNSFRVAVAAAVVAALTVVGMSGAAQASHEVNGVSKNTVKRAVQINATVFAATYAQAVKDGSNHKQAVRKASNATLLGATLPAYRVKGVNRSYQLNISDIKGRPGEAFVSVQPGYSQGMPDAGFSYCVKLNLNTLKVMYTPKAVSKPALGEVASFDSGCVKA